MLPFSRYSILLRPLCFEIIICNTINLQSFNHKHFRGITFVVFTPVSMLSLFKNLNDAVFIKSPFWSLCEKRNVNIFLYICERTLCIQVKIVIDAIQVISNNFLSTNVKSMEEKLQPVNMTSGTRNFPSQR